MDCYAVCTMCFLRIWVKGSGWSGEYYRFCADFRGRADNDAYFCHDKARTEGGIQGLAATADAG